MPRGFARAARFADVKTLEELVGANLSAHGLVNVVAGVGFALDKLTYQRRWRAYRYLYLGALRAIGQCSIDAGLGFGEIHINRRPDATIYRALAKLHIRSGNIIRPLGLLLELGPSPALTATVQRLEHEREVLLGGVCAKVAQKPRTWLPVSDRRILYYVAQARPYHSSGYAIRTQYLVSSLVNQGWDVEVFARYGYPSDRYDFRERVSVAEKITVDSLTYHFAPARDGFRNLHVGEYHETAVSMLRKQADTNRPALVHAASNYHVGLAGVAVAKQLGIPSIYEMRGLWHMTRAARIPEFARSDHYRLTQQLEIQAAASADHVFAITEAIREMLINEGVYDQKISVIPNAVDSKLFQPMARDLGLARSLGIGDLPVIGFVGSFSGYEGLDDLIEAACLLDRQRGLKFKLLLVGDGGVYDELVNLVSERGLNNIVLFTGRVPHEQVSQYYSIIDVFAYPRKGVSVCEMVSPLKPLESMAMGKAVVASDVKALAEMVRHEETGLVHRKDDVESLADELCRLILDAGLRSKLGECAREETVVSYSWEKRANHIGEVYRRLLSGC